ncbi:MAG: aminotransferase class I/II-fold pyridoxal phosphate-dependent enzyme [Saccharofermentans sp.]|nr:aminotransferase class I/II-fold pyridoxal phosphate-dependent enzyme [Saccharofermentans sp.]
MRYLVDELNSYSNSSAIAMHMPGHKRNPDFYPDGFNADITEIYGFDNLHNPTGIIYDLESQAARIWNANSSIISVNGATAPILASVMAASLMGKILVASNCHISVWHALELSDAKFDVINPLVSNYPFCLEIDPSDISNRLSLDPEIKCVVITSPTYEGVVSDVDAISKICQSMDVALIVDESHGSHFGLNEFFPKTSKADIVIKSIHKTLHAPTQTALLLSYSDRISMNKLRHYMDIVESSSPSYVLMSGVSKVVKDLTTTPDITNNWVSALNSCRENLEAKLEHLKLFSLSNLDPSKLVILTNGVINGDELSQILREKGIEIEASFSTHIIAMTGIGDTSKSLKTFADAVIEVDRDLTGEVFYTCSNMVPRDSTVMNMSIKDALCADSMCISSREAIGKTSFKYAYRYPPGIPILLPGQLITEERINCLPDELIEVVKG